MTKRIVFAWSIWLWANIWVYAKETVTVAPIPAWVEKVAPEPESRITTEEISDGYLYLLRDYQSHISSGTQYYHYLRKIYSGTGVQKGSEIEVSYDPAYQKLVFHEVHIIRGGQRINKLEPAKFRVMRREQSKESYIYDGSLSALLILEDVRADDFIEYSFSITGRNPIYGGKFFSSFNLQYYDPLDKLFIRIIAPENRPLRIQALHSDENPRITSANGSTTYQWLLTHIPGMAMDSETPAWYNPYPRLRISEFTSWEDLAQWALPIYNQTYSVSTDLQKQIEYIRKTHVTPEKQLEAALKFVQNEIRYTGLESGIGAYQPMSPSKVFSQRFGDCKDKSLLLCRMLKDLSIEAYPALVNTSYGSEINQWLPAPGIFDHCIAQVNLNGKTYWYDPTISQQGGDYANVYFPDYRFALVIRDGTRSLTEIPVSKLSRTKATEVFRMETVGGEAELSVITEYYGYEADRERYRFSNTNLREIEKSYLNYTAKTYQEIELARPLTFSDDSLNNVFTTTETYTIREFWYAPDSTLPDNLKCYVTPQTLRDKIVLPGNRIRTMPLALEYPLVYDHTIRLELPEPWNVTEDKTEITGPGANFTHTIGYAGNTITLNYQYITLKNHIEPAELKEFVKKQNQIINELGYSLSYTPSAAASGFRLNWMMVLLGILSAGIAAWGARKLYAYDPVPVNNLQTGENLGGWLILFAIGMIVLPIRLLADVFSETYFDMAVWERIAYSTSPEYNPALAAIIAGELMYNIGMLAFAILLSVLFFSRRSSFPRLISIYYAVQIVFSTADVVLVALIQALPDAEAKNSATEIGKLIISAIIWVPYFNLSTRVKETFVRTLRVPEGMQQVYRMKVV